MAKDEDDVTETERPGPQPHLWFTHVRREEGEQCLHISHLHHYVSAYECSAEMVADLVDALEQAIGRAKRTLVPQVVDQDGEMFFLVGPLGRIDLCLRWKTYEVIRELGV